MPTDDDRAARAAAVRAATEEKKYDFGLFVNSVSQVAENGFTSSVAKVGCPRFCGSCATFPSRGIVTVPGAREAFLNAFGVGSILGSLKFLQSREVWRGCRYAVFGFALTGIGSLEYTRYRRRQEIEAVKLTVDLLNQKQSRELSAHEEMRAEQVARQTPRQYRPGTEVSEHARATEAAAVADANKAYHG